MTIEQRDPEGVLELANVLGQRRLADAERRRRGAQTAAVGDDEELTEQARRQQGNNL